MKEEIKKAITLLIVVLIILGAVYVVTEIMRSDTNTSKSNSKSKTTTTTTRVAVNTDAKYSNMIILSKVFSMPESEYMVLFYSNKNAKDSLSKSIELYDSANHDIKLYKVNYDESINKSVLQSEDNDKATTVDQLKVKGVTLITIKDGKIVSYITNYDDILKAME